MTWFKVDDKFWSHPKVILMSNQATGLWVRAGAWCAGHLTDGFITERILLRISPDSARSTRYAAEELVECGLWRAVADGFQFHDWLEYQPTRDKVEAERAASKERQERYRQKARDKNASVTHLSHRDKRRDKRRESQRPDPTRPDPTSNSAPEGSALLDAECPHGAPHGPRTCALCRRNIPAITRQGGTQ